MNRWRGIFAREEGGRDGEVDLRFVLELFLEFLRLRRPRIAAWMRVMPQSLGRKCAATRVPDTVRPLMPVDLEHCLPARAFLPGLSLRQ